MNPLSISVAVDVGSTRHLPDGNLLDEFDIDHNAVGFNEFFNHISTVEKRHHLPVAVAMEGFNGWARTLDGHILRHGYSLYSVNNLKLVRYKEIFPAPAKADASTRAGFSNCSACPNICRWCAMRCMKSPRRRLPTTSSNASRGDANSLSGNGCASSTTGKAISKRCVPACWRSPVEQTTCGFSIFSPAATIYPSWPSCGKAACWRYVAWASSMRHGYRRGRHRRNSPPKSNGWAR